MNDLLNTIFGELTDLKWSHPLQVMVEQQYLRTHDVTGQWKGSHSGHGRGYPTGKKKHVCPSCPYTTDQHSHIMAHYRTHTGEKPFSCPYCSHHTITSSDLKKHIRTHTGEKPFSCPLCPYRAIQNNTLKNHMRTHYKNVH